MRRFAGVAVAAVAVAGVPATVPVDTTVGAAAIVGGLIVPGTVAAGEAGDGAEAAGAGSLWPEQSGISDVLHMMPLRKAAVSRPLLMLALDSTRSTSHICIHGMALDNRD